MKKKKTNYAYQGITDGPKPEVVAMTPADAQKNYLSILYYQAKQRNNLLGEFSSDGKYAIKDEKILKELILLPKKFDEKKDNVVYASTKIEDDIVLNFKLEFQMAEDFCRGTLSIIEIEQNADESIKHITKLDEYMDIYSPRFKEEMFKRWKVYFDEEVYDKNDYIYSLLHMQREEYLFNKELTEILSQLYMVRIFKLLDNCGEVGEKIKAEYKILVEKLMQQDPSIMQDNTRLKLILDSIIMKNKALPALLQTKEGIEVFVGYSAPIQRMKDKTTSVIINVGGGAEKKSEEPAKAAKPATKKSGGKSKGKSGGGKDSSKLFVYDFSKNFKAASYGGAPNYKVAKQVTNVKPTQALDAKPAKTEITKSEAEIMAEFREKSNNRADSLDKTNSAETKAADTTEMYRPKIDYQELSSTVGDDLRITEHFDKKLNSEKSKTTEISLMK